MTDVVEEQVGVKDFVEEVKTKITKEQVIANPEVQHHEAKRRNLEKRPQMILSVVYTFAYFTLVFGLLVSEKPPFAIPEARGDIIIGLIGILTAAQTQILNFWFGSSSGSKDKNK